MPKSSSNRKSFHRRAGRRRGGAENAQALPPPADRAAEAILAKLSIPAEWPAAARQAAGRLPRQVCASQHPGREDLRALPLATIDGESARDFDDAVFAEPRKGGWRLLVAIADVAQYVKPGSALDQEAWERGTSVYLPDRVIPMLPEALSNGLCSLRPRQDRLALACDMRIDASGEVSEFRFCEAVIRSWERLTYTQVGAFLEGEQLPVQSPVAKSLAALADAYRALRRARERRGALDFDSRESALTLKNGAVIDIAPVLRNDAHRLIEEAMIAANVCAARFLERRERRALLRVHEPPDPLKAEDLARLLNSRGIRWSAEDARPGALQSALQSALQAVDGERHRWLFQLLVLRAMQQAVYTPEAKGHYGLALERYMHFTSPIRRYPDLATHRVIKRALRGRAGQAAPMDWWIETGEQCSRTERRAEEASRAVDAWLKCEFLADRLGEKFAAVVAGVTEFGLFLELTGFYIQGLVHVSALGGDYYHYRPEAMSLVGESSGARFTLGDELEVRLVAVQPELQRLDLALADAPRRRWRRRRG